MNREQKLQGLSLILLCAAALAVFSPLFEAGFISWDDPYYVTQNKRVQEGVSWQNVKWAFSTLYFGFYYPLTWLSHMLDYDLYGRWAGGHHLTSVLFHVGSTLLLFAAMRTMTGQPWPALLTAALFALHPLHVESVAWISERKDALGAFFFMGVLYAYARYAHKPSMPRYLVVFLCLLCGLMAKSTLVTAPFVLILLDYWPLRRVWHAAPAESDHCELQVATPCASAGRLVVEKVPLLALSVVFSVLTMKAQVLLGAVTTSEILPPGIRLGNALISLAGYLEKTVVPAGLAIYYPYPLGGLPLWRVLASAALTLLVTGLALLWIRRRPYWFVGWFWYLLMILPVLGIVQAGRQASADRYTYLSLEGVFIILAWATAEAANKYPSAKKSLAAFWLVALVVFGGLSYRQAGFWKNNLTLFGHALDVTTGNDVAESNYGVGLYMSGDLSGAKRHLKEAIRLRPEHVVSWGNLGEILAKEGKYREAEACYVTVLRLSPGDARAHCALGLLSEAQGRIDEALTHYETAIRLDPNSQPAQAHLARVRDALQNKRSKEGNP